MFGDHVDAKQFREGNKDTLSQRLAKEEIATAKNKAQEPNRYKGALTAGAILTVSTAVMAIGVPAVTDQVPTLVTQVGAAVSAMGALSAIAVRLPQKAVEHMTDIINRKSVVIPREIADQFEDMAADAVKIFSTGAEGVWYIQTPDGTNSINAEILSDAEMKVRKKELSKKGVPIIEIMPEKGWLKKVKTNAIPPRISMTQTLNGKPFSRDGEPHIFTFDVQSDLTLELVKIGKLDSKGRTRVEAPAPGIDLAAAPA